MTEKNVFVLGMDALNREVLRDLDGDYRFRTLLDKEQIAGDPLPEMSTLLELARERLDRFSGSIDALVGYWDFPVSSMLPILCAERDLPGPDLAPVVCCEHKYWSRLEQRAAIPEYCPGFALVDLEADDLPDELDYPVWLKPVKSASSELAFRVENPRAFAEALEEIRAGIDSYAEPFEFVMDRIHPPPAVVEAGAAACLAEEAAAGRQLTAEGFEFDGEITIYGVIDSVNYPDSASFQRYQYPADLPESVTNRVMDASRRVIDRIGLRSTTFNIEYFWDPRSDRVTLLEINPRLSQSHARLFQLVDGMANHDIMVRLALGRRPHVPRRQGHYRTAAKWFVRRFSDGVVTRTPSPDEVASVERAVEGLTVDVRVSSGDVLSELPRQDSYSYELADLYIGAEGERELISKYEQAMDGLTFEIEESAAT